MRIPFAERAKTELEIVRTIAISHLDSYPADSAEYQKIIEHVAVLSKQIQADRPEKLSPNTIAVVLGNLSVAGLVLWFERDNVLNTKMFAFLQKPKDSSRS